MRADVQQVADGTYLVHGSNTNWVILTEADAVTLVDTGYPGDREQVLASLTQVGSSPEAVAAVLITHAHNDHLGSAEYLRATYGTPVYLHEAEVPHARREFLHQVSVGTVLRNGWRPGVLPWAVHALRSGGTTPVPVTAPQAFPTAGALDLPGRPVPVHTPGHTDGHCAYHLPGTGVLISGDALVSGHPTSRVEGPQLLPDMFHHERPRALASLDVLAELEGGLLLPGHGPVHRGPVRDAALRARERAL
ncbi:MULTISPECIES: MBL fold metallo-hydrolase [Streptomyces]|uniref:Glyoxylase-like metal-dependent hydrolase (Beta-lactamase superfamily II) n=2 Tax=Streptomyces TaxID=1883 RepID=A0AA89QS75_STRCU|nr:MULTISPECIES: MBL fold metallo-hydrolase [Streptomyces]MBB5816499.1 glyoxylase-like metal-dependent hydrolase (beta-lactamase superfamily II) [Streptomyces collinus]MEC7051780.1 MBL fold metallo-hydrolase [Streptomyces violaceochromogenes]WMX62217.1 MBL fold metallo-hydrolase [Streptomyces collinus]GHC92988.1 MBL fold metallo-hydrolase [Streptomyces violaceochromogenes]